MRRTLMVLAILACGAPLRADDQPVAGERMLLRPRRAAIALADAAIQAPFPAPANATLVVSGGARSGQCHFETRLDADRWRALEGDGGENGYVYRGARGSGVRFALIRPGRIAIHAEVSTWGCDLSDPLRQPLRVELGLGGRRYCAGFTDPVINDGGRYIATLSAAPEACAKSDLTAATLNILHGVTGTGCLQTANCRQADRADLLFDWIRARGCPDVVTLQEVSTSGAALLQQHLGDTCPFTYELAYQRVNGVDDSMILSRYPIVDRQVRLLLNNFRRVVAARIDHPIGPLWVFTTHLASGSDGATSPCGASCPPECVAAGAATVRECQAVQTADFAEELHGTSRVPALISGDFNESPGTFAYRVFADRGWRDAYLDAGNPECVPTTGVGCTSGRADQDLSQLESPQSNESERIDYIFVSPAAVDSACSAAIDPAGDADGDGVATSLFADAPNPFASPCGATPQAICWPSDHVGVQVDLNCR